MMDHKTNPWRLLRMPIIIATIAGLSWSSLNLTVPASIASALDMLGQISIPLLLFTLGVRLITVDLAPGK